MRISCGFAFALVLGCGAVGLAGPRDDRAEKVPEARAMVQLRDRWFIRNAAGRGAVDFYYRYSPYAAFALGQDGRDDLKFLAGSGLAGLRLLFRGALLWMPAAGSLIVIWLMALASSVLRRAPAVGPIVARRGRQLLVAAVALFLAAVAFSYVRPGEAMKRDRIAAIRAAFQRGELPPEMIASAHRDPDPDVRYELTYALAERPAPEDRTIFLEAVQDSDVRVRSWGLHGLGNLADREAVPAVLACLADPCYNVRYRAAWALGAIGDPAARKPLEDLAVHDEHVYVRYYAAEAIDQLAGGRR